MKFWGKYKPLIIFVIITSAIVLFGFIYIKPSEIQNTKNPIWNTLLILDTATASALAVLAFMAYLEYAKGEDDIILEFDVLDENLNSIGREPIEIVLLRKDVSRAEILGIMGMIQKKSVGRYEIDNRIQKILIDRINELQKGREKRLLIPIILKDYEKFFREKL